MGSGKSTGAFAVAALPGRGAIDLARVIESEAGESTAELVAGEGAAGRARPEADGAGPRRGDQGIGGWTVYCRHGAGQIVRTIQRG